MMCIFRSVFVLQMYETLTKDNVLTAKLLKHGY